MNKKFIVTIGRQYGSGGREIGKRLAEKLGVDFYDKELITLAAKKHGMSEKVFESVDEKPTNSLLYSLAVGAYGMDGGSPYWGETVRQGLSDTGGTYRGTCRKRQLRYRGQMRGLHSERQNRHRQCLFDRKRRVQKRQSDKSLRLRT